MTLVFGDVRFPDTSKGLLKRLWSKELTQEAFLRECAYWALKDGFEELRPHPAPNKPYTQAFNEFEGLPPERKAKVDPEFFRKNEEILKYYQDYYSAKWTNQHTLDWLKEIRSYLPPEDNVSIARVDERIKEFNARQL